MITGSSNGIDSAAARQLQQHGHEVVIVGRSPGKTLAVARETRADHFLADLTRLDEVCQRAAELDAAYPRIDMLANNAGAVFGDRTSRRRLREDLPGRLPGGVPAHPASDRQTGGRRGCGDPDLEHPRAHAGMVRLDALDHDRNRPTT